MTAAPRMNTGSAGHQPARSGTRPEQQTGGEFRPGSTQSRYVAVPVRDAPDDASRTAHFQQPRMGLPRPGPTVPERRPRPSGRQRDFPIGPLRPSRPSPLPRGEGRDSAASCCSVPSTAMQQLAGRPESTSRPGPCGRNRSGGARSSTSGSAHPRPGCTGDLRAAPPGRRPR
jgi:hypothetical protein